LRKCLNSAIAQSYQNLEILIIDDGSNDETLEIAFEYAANNEKIRVIRNESKKGMVANWNMCIREAKGEWIKFLFQDDFLEPECVSEMMQACITNKCLIAVCRRDFQIEDCAPADISVSFQNSISKPESFFKQSKYYSPGETIDIVKYQLLNNIIGEPTCFLFNKKITAAYGDFNIHLKQLVDYEFILRGIINDGFVFLNETYATFRVHESSQTSANIASNQIRAERGDTLILLCTYISDRAYKKLRSSVGALYLKSYLNYIYYKSCKVFGEKIFRLAIPDILQVYPTVNRLKYSFLNYVMTKVRFKWTKQFI